MTSPAAASDAAKTLWLLRHAKAVTDPPAGGTDHERPLTPRGVADATALGRLLRGGAFPDAGPLPGLVLCSTATRASETARLVLAGVDAVFDFRRSLYNGEPGDILGELRTAPEEVGSVLVVGHNPTIQLLALGLLAPGDAAGRTTLEQAGFPTCALACYRLAARRWLDAAESSATLTGFSAPP